MIFPASKGASKYRAVRTTFNGISYPSKAEAARAEYLTWAAERGHILWWIGQPKFRLGCAENVYQPDFLVVMKSGVHVEDVKGMETQKFRRDRRLWKRYGPCPLWVIKGKHVEIVAPGGEASE